MASWAGSAAALWTFGAWGVCGLVALLLAPANPASRRLAVAGALLVTTRLLEHLIVTDAVMRVAWRDAWVPRVLEELTFLGALAAVVATLAVFPDGRYDRRWHRGVVRALVAATAVVTFCRVLGSATVASGADTDPGTRNPLAVPALAPLDVVADTLAATEPAWLLAGVALLGLRYRRGDAERRTELRWPLRALLVLAAALAAIVVGITTGLDLFLPEIPFLLALSLFPIALLAAVVRRVRRLETRLAASRARLVTAEDAARRRVERDLHDGVQQQLVAILSLVELAQRQVARDPAVAGTTLRDIADETREAVADLREVVAGIHPAVLTDRGLVAAVEARLQRLPVAARLAADPATRGARWEPAVEGAAYFGACEAVANALRHAPGAALEVQVEEAPGGVRVRVADDGPGFDPATTEARGLLGVRDRVESLGGSLDVTGGPGAGTVVDVWLPGDS